MGEGLSVELLKKKFPKSYTHSIKLEVLFFHLFFPPNL